MFTIFSFVLLSSALAPPFGLGSSEYVDASFGFSLRPPKGWRVVGERSGNTRDTTLLRMTDPAPGDAPPDILVRLIRAPRNATMEQVFQEAQAQAQRDFGKGGPVSLLGSMPRRIAGQPGGKMTMQFTVAGRAVIRFQAFIQAPTDPKARAARYFTLVYTGPKESQAKAEPLFDSVVSSFKLIQDARSEKEIRAALARGKAWMASLKGVRLADKRLPTQYYKVYLNDREAGCLQVSEEPAIVNKVEGVRIVERGWTFPSNGESQHVTNDLFLSADLSRESWTNRTVTLIPPRGAVPAALGLSLQEGVRQEDRVITSECNEYGVRPTNNEPIKIEREFYGPRLLVRWLPRLVDLKKPTLYAFTGYDYDREGLVLRTVEVKGGGLGLGGASYQVRDREGLWGAPSDMWFDAQGRLLKLSAGPLKMDLSDEATLRSRWESKALKAEADIKVLETEYQKSLIRFKK